MDHIRNFFRVWMHLLCPYTAIPNESCTVDSIDRRSDLFSPRNSSYLCCFAFSFYSNYCRSSVFFTCNFMLVYFVGSRKKKISLYLCKNDENIKLNCWVKLHYAPCDSSFRIFTFRLFSTHRVPDSRSLVSRRTHILSLVPFPWSSWILLQHSDCIDIIWILLGTIDPEIDDKLHILWICHSVVQALR